MIEIKIYFITGNNSYQMGIGSKQNKKKIVVIKSFTTRTKINSKRLKELIIRHSGGIDNKLNEEFIVSFYVNQIK